VTKDCPAASLRSDPAARNARMSPRLAIHPPTSVAAQANSPARRSIPPRYSRPRGAARQLNSKAFADRQVAPTAWHLAERNALMRMRRIATTSRPTCRQYAAQLATLTTLDREAQADFVLPTDLTAAVRAPVAESDCRRRPHGNFLARVSTMYSCSISYCLGQSTPDPAILGSAPQPLLAIQ
jgi:hypothetical protein